MLKTLKQYVGRGSVSFEKRFTGSVILLTLFYSIVLGIIILISASVTYTAFSSRIGARFSRYPQITITLQPVDRHAPTAAEVRHDLVVSLVVVNGTLFVLAVGVSYALALLTLSPLKQAYDEQRRFIADASHELKTPLAIMRMELENEIASASEAGAREKAAGHLQEIDRMSGIIKDLLLLSQLEAAGNRELAPVDLAAAIRDCLKRLEAVAASQQVSLSFDDPGSAVMVLGDGQVPHILMNVVHNAIAYNKPGGTAAITIRSEKSSALVEVRDTGIGMSPEDALHAFDRFYRSDRSRSRATGGSGLGLSIAQRSAESIGASISVESQLDAGTTVRISFKKA